MKEYDFVEVTVEKEKYARDGVHKGMQGTILDPRNIDGNWLVFFADPVTGADTIGIPIKEDDLKLIYRTPEKKEGDTVLLIAHEAKYSAYGVTKGMKGIICTPCDEKNCFEIRFVLPDGTEKRLSVNKEDVVLVQK